MTLKDGTRSKPIAMTGLAACLVTAPVVRQLKNDVEKQRTKTERARIVQFELNLVPILRVLMAEKHPNHWLLSVGAHNRRASRLREALMLAECKREALHVPKSDPMSAHMKFHNLRDTCLTHMAVRRDPPQDVQWRAGHTTPAMTEAYISNARYQAGTNFGTPLPPLPDALLAMPASEGSTGGWAQRWSKILVKFWSFGRKQTRKHRESSGGAGNRTTSGLPRETGSKDQDTKPRDVDDRVVDAECPLSRRRARSRVLAG